MSKILKSLVGFFASLILLMPSPSHCAGVFLSIDCGASESYKDENSIEWSGDSDYIQNGDSKTVEFTSLVHYPMSTLRAFSTRKKNCYSIPVDKGERILVRASFYYGNYDGKSSPPVFDLQFDGNYWATVNTSGSSFDVISHEVIYVIKGDSTSICVAQTQPDQLPFISALELRSLASTMYSHITPNYAMHMIRRAAFGATQTIRYPLDAYNRIWQRAGGFGLTSVSNAAVTIKVTAENNPPSAVLENAVTVASTSNYIILLTALPDKPVPIYMAIYFSEVDVLGSTSRRSFQVNVNDKPYSDTIIPPFGGVSQVYITNMTASSKTSIAVVPTSDSTLPPIVNAMEIYFLSGPLTSGTNSKDVEGLVALQKAFEILQEWSGDPCLPSPYSWDWVECSSHPIPRVTALYLSGFGLYGSLPDFSSMDALQTIDMHNNSIEGPIPAFLGDLPNLTLLNLADNRFNGTIPSSLSQSKKLTLVTTGNCFSGNPCEKRVTSPSPSASPSPRGSPTTPTDAPSTPNFNTFRPGSGTNKLVLQPLLLLSLSLFTLHMLF